MRSRHELYRAGKYEAILSIVDACLPKDAAGNFITAQEKSDVIHDLLAFLAEQMLEMNKRKLPIDPARREPGETLRAEFDGSMARLWPLRQKIDATDRLIDGVVYRLYGLTEEEIGIVEGDHQLERDHSNH